MENVTRINRPLGRTHQKHFTNKHSAYYCSSLRVSFNMFGISNYGLKEVILHLEVKRSRH